MLLPRVLNSFLLALLLANTSLYGQSWRSERPEFMRRAGFSQAMAIDGVDVIVARTGESILYPSPTSQKGGVFIFSNEGDEWKQTDAIMPAGVEIGHRFGQALVVFEDRLAVAAPGADNGCGVIYVFNRDANGSWEQETTLEHPACEANGRLGWSLSSRGSTLIAGAPGDGKSSGLVVSYEPDEEGAWYVKDVLFSSKEGTYFGEKVVAYPSGLMVGAPADDEKGIVHVFGLDSDEAIAQLTPSTDDASLFGLEIAVQEDLALISAPGMRVREMESVPPKTGAVYVFAKRTESWEPLARIQPELIEGDAPSTLHGFGSATAFNGNEAWIGAPYAGSSGGSVYIYDTESASDAWTISQVLSTRPLASQATFGAQLAVKGNLGVVGAIRADFGEGRGIIFVHDGTGWQQESLISDSGRDIAALTGEEMKCIDGAAGPFACENVDLLSFLPIEDIGGEKGVIVNDVWGWTDPETGKEYAILGRSNGTSFIDVSDPTRPLFIGDLPATEGSNPNHWRDVKVYANHAFVVADGAGRHGMQVFDLTRLRNIESPPVTLEATALYDKVHSAHNVVINEETGFAYIVAASAGGETCGGGYHMVDISNPVEPTFAGCFSDPSSGAGGTHIHDAQCVLYDGPDADYQDKEICFGANASVFSIADVTDKENPKTISALDYPKVAYVHQGWLAKGKKYFYINDEADEVSGLVEATRTLIWDVTDLDDPVYLKAYLGTTRASDHNFYVKDDLMYQSNYASGLQIIDVSDPVNLKEVAHFDTVPWGDNAPGFAGSWSNYPYFESGTIVVSSITEGLFLLKKSKQQLP